MTQTGSLPALLVRWPRLPVYFLVMFVLCFLLYGRSFADGPETVFSSLHERLQNDGFDGQDLRKYYTSSPVRFEEESIASFFRHTESRLNYEQFLSKASLRKSRGYMKQQAPWLKKAETCFQVSPEIITAVLLVETRLGTFLGRDSALGILSSLAALADPAVREMFWKTMQAKTHMTKAAFRKKADRKSRWAYIELKALLTYVKQEDIGDPGAIRGSYAGAIGIPQFMPSNILALGVDGDEDGRVDLFTHADAILSVANYLHHYGWKPDLGEKKAYRVLFSYNHSKYYVHTILQIAEKLKEAA